MSETLPLPVEELPPQLKRFCDPGAPGPARAMAAKGLVPVKGADLVQMLLQLSADPDAAIQASAKKSLGDLPEGVIETAASSEIHSAFLGGVAREFASRENVVERVAANPNLFDAALEEVARSCSERVSERIAVNQQRLLGAPKIIEALYKNKNTRMSTADRLIELCARNGVELTGIPAFKAHCEAIKGQLMVEPMEEALPTDSDFIEALAEDDELSESDAEVIAIDEEEGTEEVNDASMPLMMRIGQMSTPEKIRLALVGNAAARALLVRDNNRTVSTAAIQSPSMNDSEAAAIAASKEIGEDILRFIGSKREWLRNHEVKHNLVFNPKTPLGIALRFVPHMRDGELKALSKSRAVPQSVKSAAMQKIEAKEQKGKKKKK